jgi:hypothetical protein
MSKTWEQYHNPSCRHEWAACHYKETAKYDEAEGREKAMHHAYLAHGHNEHAIHHDAEAAKLYADRRDVLANPFSRQGEAQFCARSMLAVNRTRWAAGTQARKAPYQALPLQFKLSANQKSVLDCRITDIEDAGNQRV